MKGLSNFWIWSWIRREIRKYTVSESAQWCIARSQQENVWLEFHTELQSAESRNQCYRNIVWRKNQRSKISWNCPFNNGDNVFLSLAATNLRVNIFCGNHHNANLAVRGSILCELWQFTVLLIRIGWILIVLIIYTDYRQSYGSPSCNFSAFQSIWN
jgi:hypothetical protein